MLTIEQQTQVQSKLKSMLIIYGALGLGMLAMLGAIALIVDWQKLSTEAGLMSLMAAVTGLMTFGMSFIFPKLMSSRPADIAASMAKQHDTTEVPADKIITSLVNNSLTSKIVTGALIEGGVFLNLIVFLLEPTTVSLAVIVIGLVIFLLRFPFVGRQVSQLSTGLEEVQRELRHLQRF